MLRRADIFIFGCGLLLSLLLHGFLIVPTFMRSMNPASPDRPLQARFEPQDFEQPDAHPPPPAVALGIEARTPSTFTWIGYDEYREHLVALSEFEQAAFTPEPSPSHREPAAAAAAPAVTEIARQDVAEAVAEIEAEAPDTVVPAAELVRASLRTLRQWIDQIDLESLPEQLPDLAQPSVREENPEDAERHLAAGDDSADRVEAPRAAAETVRADERREETEEKSEKREAAVTVAQRAPSDWPEEPSPTEASGEPGDVADKESEPTTTIEVPLEQIRLGQPIARPGLEVKPRRPHFTLLTRLTASPGNPVVEVRFGRDGIPLSAEVIQSSGNSTVDHAVETSLYRWRASGKQLDELSAERTLNVRIVIVLRS